MDLNTLGCGSNEYWQATGCRSESDDYVTTPTIISLKEVVSDICCGFSFSGAISPSREKIICWGSNQKGQCGNGNFDKQQRPKEVLGVASEVKKLCMGHRHSLALIKSQIWVWGSNSYGEHGSGEIVKRGGARAMKIEFFEKLPVKDISTSPNHCVAITAEVEALYVWGRNNFGQSGLENVYPHVRLPKKLIFSVLERVRCLQVQCSSYHNLAIVLVERDEGTKRCVMTWGYSGLARLGLGAGLKSGLRVTPREIELLSAVQEESGLVVTKIGVGYDISFCVFETPTDLYFLDDVDLQDEKIELFLQLNIC